MIVINDHITYLEVMYTIISDKDAVVEQKG
jgi:hypothetical protein